MKPGIKETLKRLRPLQPVLQSRRWMRQAVRRWAYRPPAVRFANPFTASACAEAGVARPDHPAGAVEHYGQGAEDLIVSGLLRAMALERKADLRGKRYLEIGANHPFAASATYLLSRALGMSGVLVEANPRLLPDLRRGRPGDTVVHAAVQDQAVGEVMLSISRLSEISSLDRSHVLHWEGGRVGERAWVPVPALRLGDLFRRQEAEGEVVFLSVDVEGLDLTLLRDLDLRRHRPWVVQAEASLRHAPAEAEAMIAHLRAAGYRLAAVTDVNLIFAEAGRP